jgi:hypothetical protein
VIQSGEWYRFSWTSMLIAEDYCVRTFKYNGLRWKRSSKLFLWKILVFIEITWILRIGSYWCNKTYFLVWYELIWANNLYSSYCLKQVHSQNPLFSPKTFYLCLINDIAEISLKVALNTISLTLYQYLIMQVTKFTSCLSMVGGSLWVFRLLPPLKLVAMI